jgi:hypothetical protein
LITTSQRLILVKGDDNKEVVAETILAQSLKFSKWQRQEDELDTPITERPVCPAFCPMDTILPRVKRPET